MIFAASGEARYAISAAAPLLSLKATAWSPAVTTPDFEPPIDGQSKNLAPAPTLVLPSLAISAATKSPSKSIADRGRSPNTSAIDCTNFSCTAPAGPPWMVLGVFQ